MSFFESPPPPRPPDDVQGPQPAWIGPAENVLGASADLELVLARTEDVAVGVNGFVAEPNGVAFLLDFRRRFGAFPGSEWGRPFPPMHPSETRGEADFRFGVQFSDGRKATTLQETLALGRVDLSGPSPPPRLIPRGGSGGGQHAYQQGYWLWPLPPPGVLAFVCEWRAAGIAETRVEVDAGPIIAGSARATILWPLPDRDPGRDVGWTSY